VPDLATPQEVQPQEPRPFRWHWVIVALLAVNTVLVVLLLKDRGAEVATAPVTEQATIAEPASEQAQAVVPAVQQAFPPNDQAMQPASQTGNTQASTPPAPEKAPPPAIAEPVRPRGEVVILPETARTQNRELSILPEEDLDTPGVGMTAPREEPQLQSWFDLPQASRNNLDLPRLDVHVYSESSQGRFIMVNLKKYREGDTLPNGMVLEEILPDGMIMSYRGERFRVDK